MNIVIGYCHYGIVHERFMQSLIDLLAYETSRGINLIRTSSAQGAYIAECRNIIVEEFLKTDAEWLLFLDIDMTFTPDLLCVLQSVADEGHNIVAGFYLTQAKGKLCASWLEYGAEGVLRTVGKIEKDKVVKLASAGMGGTLISRRVFESIETPGDNYRWFGHDLINGVRHGEDVTFCLRAKQAGYTPYGVTAAQLGHLKTRCLDIDALCTKQS